MVLNLTVYLCFYVMQEKDIDLLVSIRFLHIAQYFVLHAVALSGASSLLLHVNELQNHP